MPTIIAIVHKQGSAFGVSYPDFPGLATGGDTVEDALRRSKDGLSVHIEAMIEDDEAMPRLRSFEEIRADPALADDLAGMFAFAMVEYDLWGNRAG